MDARSPAAFVACFPSAGYLGEMELRREIDRLLEADDLELSSEHGRAELEDVLQRAFVAVQVGEMWIDQLRRALDSAGEDTGRMTALLAELGGAEQKLDAIRAHVARLYARSRELRVGSVAHG